MAAALPRPVAAGRAPCRRRLSLTPGPHLRRDPVLPRLRLPRRGAAPPPPRPAPPVPHSPHPPGRLRAPQRRPPGPLRRHGCRLRALRRVHGALLEVALLLAARHAAVGPRLLPGEHVFYLSKIYELGDTLLILLARRPLTLLHVYHHAVVIAMCYLWLATRQSLSLMPIALVTNAAVHVVMYGYYLCCSLGLRWPPRWNRAVTELQIAQFLFSFAASAVVLWLHFAAGGCEGMAGWAFNAVFNATLLALFLDFHGAAYAAAKKSSSSNKGKGD